MFLMNNEIMSIAAYIPFCLLPEYVRHEIQKQFTESITENNSECYVRLEKDNGYIVDVSAITSEDEPPKVARVYLAELTEQERQQINLLIVSRLKHSIAHINEIY